MLTSAVATELSNTLTTRCPFFGRLVLLVFCLGACTLRPISAQTVTGQVVDSISGTPVGTGFVVLLDHEDQEAARALSRGDGHFQLVAPGAGIYRLRSERIGYTAFTSPPFELREGQDLEQTLRILAQAIVLAAVEVHGENRCHSNPDEAVETGLVWQEIRKALAATAWDGTQELARYRAYGYRRSLDLSRQEVRSEEGSLAEGYAGQPYSSISVERLLSEGFIVERADGIWYNLPDAGVLQDDDFLAAHCFHVVRDSTERPGQIGLAFEPFSNNALPDVRGALWLDELTSELRVLEVSFTELPYGVEHDRVGGTVEFLMLPSGAWIVHRWQLRTPMIRALTGSTRETGDRSQRIGLMGFNDTGGDVLEITTRDGAKVFPPGLAHLTGVLYDSSKAGPLVGARIHVEGTEFWGSSNARGEFHVTAPIEGEFWVTPSHPWIDSIALTPPRKVVRLGADETETISFVLPHANSIAKRLCSYETDSAESATIVGEVRAGSPARPSSGRDVSAVWYVLEHDDDRLVPARVERSTRTDESGFYVLCGLPVGVPVTVSTNGARSANVLFPMNEEGTLLFARNRDVTQPYTRSFRTRHRTWKVDLLLTGRPPTRRSGEARTALSGYIADQSTGRPLGEVTVVLNGGDSTETRMDGTFDLMDVDLRMGSNTVTASRSGYQLWTREVWLDEGLSRLDLSIQLEP